MLAAPMLLDQPDFRRRRALNWLLAGAMYAFFYMARYNFTAINARLADLFGWSNTQLGVFDSSATLVYGAAVFLNGPIADRIGGRRAILFGAAGTAFFNVLFGSLSLVGPRPHAIAAQSHNLLYNEVVDGYFARHKVKPGVTGWAQINGWRGEMDTNEKIRMRTEYDLYYIENWSMLFDLRILFLTPVRRLNTENAY